MGEKTRPEIYSIAAHRGFADALVAGLIPRYREDDFGLARLTLLLPSSRAVRTITEAFVRQVGSDTSGGSAGMLLPRMAVVGDLELDEALGPLLDPLGLGEIPPAIDPTERLFSLAEIVSETLGGDAPPVGGLLELAREYARTMDRLLVEAVEPDELLSDRVANLFDDLAKHWQDSLRHFAIVQRKWLSELQSREMVDAPTRRNMLFDAAARQWKETPLANPIVAAGVTSASPALARLLATIAFLPKGAVVLPDLDLGMSADVWDQLGRAGARPAPDQAPFAKGDAATHPQYHLKLLLNRMGIAREEVRHWHRKGDAAGPPERSHAIGALFLPPAASPRWIGLPPEKRRLSGVRMMETSGPEAEAQSVALLARRALDTAGKRIAIVTPDRTLARRIVHHLRRWNVEADDSAGRPLSQSPAGRLFLLLAEVASGDGAPVALVSVLAHPLVRREADRAGHLRKLRRFDKVLRGPRPEGGLAPLDAIAAKAGIEDWWAGLRPVIADLLSLRSVSGMAEMLEGLSLAAEALCDEQIWAQEDGRALSQFVDEWREKADAANFSVTLDDLPRVLFDALDEIAVRPPYGGHPRIAVYGLLEARMSRADLIICAGMNEGIWPARTGTESLLAPVVMREVGVPSSEFRIGLAAHDLAGALGGPEVVLSRSERDAEGPAIASRFWLKVKALLGGDLRASHSENAIPEIAAVLDSPPATTPAERPRPMPDADQRKVPVSVTALDRLRSDPFQFYASHILRLRDWERLEAEPTPAWQGTLAHRILERWGRGEGSLDELAGRELAAMDAHPLVRQLWYPRLMRGLEWVARTMQAEPSREGVLFEEKGSFNYRGIKIRGQIDRLDRLADGTYAIVDYKTGRAPSGTQVAAGYALQLGTLGIMLEDGGFEPVTGKPSRFEYWSLARNKDSETGFGKIETPLRIPPKRTGIEPEDFMPEARRFLDAALDDYLLGTEPFTAKLNPDAMGYDTYDQLMRLAEWLGRDGESSQ